MEKFDSFFKVRKNVIFERARFNKRNQQQGEPAEQYIMELADNCDYGLMTAEIIRDKLVVGIRDGPLSERLQLDPDLTLEKAKKMIRQREPVQEQQKVLKGTSETGALEELKSKREVLSKESGRKPRYHRNKVKATTKQHSHVQQKQCARCGKGQHTRDKCPARDVTCYRCQRKGHYSTHCLSKTVGETSTENQLDSAFLDTISAMEESSWLTTVRLCGQETVFKLDTGAEVTAISLETLKTLRRQNLSAPKKVLYGPSHSSLEVAGQFEGRLSHKSKSSLWLYPRKMVLLEFALTSNH